MAAKEQLQDVQWLQNLQVEMGGTFTWAYDELDDSFNISGERYTIKSLLGEGSFGSVYHCTREAVEEGCNAQDVAVKIISTDRISILTGCSNESVIRRMLHESELLGRLGGHPHIVQLHCAAISQTSFRIFMVMQLLSCSDLFNELLRRRKAFPENEAGQIVRQLAMAVSHCHRHLIAHRDIKLENIMLANRSPPVLKLIDFGQAQFQGARATQGVNVAAIAKCVQTAKTLTTSKLYTSPDVKQAIEENETYDAFKLDSFGIGVICYGLLCSSLPEAAKGGEFQKGPKWTALSANAKDIIQRLLCPDPHERLSVAEVLQHPFVATTGAVSVSTKMSTPGDFEHELRALTKSQALVKALQRERGASCWMLDGSNDAEMRCKWMCAATNDRFDEAIDAVEDLQCEKGIELGKTLRRTRSDLEEFRTMCRKCEEQDGFAAFETIFATYCRNIAEVIHLIGRLMVIIQKQDAPLTVAELRIRLLLLVSEQLGRERGFICGHLRDRNLLMSWPVRRRFAMIQGCRQFLLGSTSLESAESGVVSFAAGLLPGLRLVDAPLISQADLQVLEDAETAVLECNSSASEWFIIITDLIDKVHQQASVAFLGLVQDIAQKASASPIPTGRTSSCDPLSPTSQRETMAPSQSANGSEGTLPAQSTQSVPLDAFRGHEGGFPQQRNADIRTSAGCSSFEPEGSLPAHGTQSFPLDGFRSRAGGATSSQQCMMAAAGAGFQQQQNNADLRTSTPGVISEQQETFEFYHLTGCNSTPEGMYGASLPMKVMTPARGTLLATPELTPLHPGVWRGRGVDPLSASLLPLAGLQNPVQGYQPERMFGQQGHLDGQGGMYVPEAQPPPVALIINNSLGRLEKEPPGLSTTRPEAQGMPSSVSAAGHNVLGFFSEAVLFGTSHQQPSIPPPPVNNFPEQQPRKDVLISKGTIGHPISCRGLGCKFAAKDRGCKEGGDCLRCHLCVWKRAPEKEAQKK